MKQNEIIVDFRICDFDDITHEELTEQIGINPVKIHVKGAKKNPKNPNSPLIQKNDWLMSSGVDKYSSFDEHMQSLLNILESKSELFKPICEKYYCEFVCALFVHVDNGESTPWIHLDSRYNRIIKELNIEFDVDLYIFPNDDSSEIKS